MIHGMINVYKEAGFTSHDVVAKLRGIAKQKKIGHTGTLDPDAVGVLPVCLGSATRLCDLLTEKKKSYRAVMLLGQTTDTQDVSGKVLSKQEVNCDEARVQEVMKEFLGAQNQIPPMYSALKIGGKRLYELARAGQEVEREARPVYFYSIRFLQMNGAEVEFEVTCSKGTYIRTLCHDMGDKLGCGACMKSLIRYQVDQFRIEDSYTLTELQTLADKGHLYDAVVPIDSIFAHCPAKQVTADGERFLMNGNPLPKELLTDVSDDRKEQAKEHTNEPEAESDTGIKVPVGSIRVYDTLGNFQAVYEPMGEKSYCPWKTFFSRENH